jgi:hypothetical protein
LLAVGVMLTVAVHVDRANGATDLHTIGWTLMGVGAFGIALSMVFWSSWARHGRFTRRLIDVGPTGDASTIGSEVGEATLARLGLPIDGRGDLLDQFDHSRGAA